MEQIEVNLEASTPEEISTWLGNSVKPSTASVYLRAWGSFYKWLQVNGPMSLRGLTARELVKKQKALNRAFLLDEIMLPEKKAIVYAVLEYVNHGDNAKWRSRYKMKIHSTVRSFFVYYLGKEGFPALSNGEKNRLKGSPKVRKELKIETIKAIIDNSNVMYKVVWSAMLASGMGIGELVKWSTQGIDELREAVADTIRVEGEELIEIRLQARKHNVENDFYTYIGGSALRYLKAYLKHREDMEARFNSEEYRRYREKEGRPLLSKFTDAIFVNNLYTALTVKSAQFYWTSQLKQLKLWKSRGRRTDRSNMNSHQIRMVFRTRWAKVVLPRDYSAEAQKAMGEYFTGHVIDPLDYNKIDNDRDYRIRAILTALPWLDIDKINIERQSEESGAQMRLIEELKAQLEIERRKKRETDIELKDLVEEVKWIKPVLQGLIEEKKERDRIRGVPAVPPPSK